jgi:AraC-like DNA-binding protein
MDWLSGMNAVLRHIEDNLTEDIAYEGLSKIVGCSVYEFSRIFSFMAEMSVSEYIRRRRLSQAVFDIQRGTEKIIDIALKYSYESPTTFSRAFKELHGVSPSQARKSGVELQLYPPMSFLLQIKGVAPLAFRIKNCDAFTITGASFHLNVEDTTQGLASLYNTEADHLLDISKTDMPQEILTAIEAQNGTTVTYIGEKMKIYVSLHSAKTPDNTAASNNSTAPDFMKTPDNSTAPNSIKTPDNNKTPDSIKTPDNNKTPAYITAAINYASDGGKVKTVLGFLPEDMPHHCANDKNYAEYGSGVPFSESMTPFINATTTEDIPAAVWAVFSFTNEHNAENMASAYTRILTEWFPSSGYRRVESLPHLERFNVNKKSRISWEIRLPVERG